MARLRGITGAGGDPEAIELLRNITKHAEFLLSQPATTGSNLLCETILDHMYTLGMVYQLSTNATVRSRVAQRATAELLSTAALASWCGAIVNAETRSICQDRLGTSIGKVQKKRERRFLQGSEAFPHRRRDDACCLDRL